MTARRILILSSSTGGGHDMRAAALAAWIQKVHGEAVSVRRWQALEESSRLDRFGVELYNTIQKQLPWAHHLYFNFLEVASLHRKAFGVRGRARLAGLLREFAPDVILSTHAHLNHGYFAIAKAELGSAVRCLTYCGELLGGYGFSKHWVNPEADGFIAAVEECRDEALRLGAQPERVHLGGFLLQPDFFAEGAGHTREVIRAKLFGGAIAPDQPVVLLGTGSNGAHNHPAAIAALSEVKTPLAIVALCGRNLPALQRLEAIRDSITPHTLWPLAYRDDMADVLRAVDLAFIRPGTGTTSECIVSVCPVIFNGIGGVMPQEGITVRFLQKRGAEPIVAKSPSALKDAVTNWLAGDRGAGQRTIFATINKGLSPAGIVQEVLQ